jgi:hypothetical protein
VWHSAKEYIANREFENKEELEKVVNQLLNEGGLIIKWSRKLRLFGLCYAMDGGYKGCNPYIERHLAIFDNCF